MYWSMYIPASLELRPFVPGTRYRQVVQVPDLLPTLLDLCGIATPEGLDIEKGAVWSPSAMCCQSIERRLTVCIGG